MGLIMAVCIVSFAYAERPIEELPMYGGQHNPEVETNKGFSQSAAQLGWEYFYKGDVDTAIRRFNQAWMFDRENIDALWGFGVVMGARATQEDPEHNLRESVRYLEMADSKSNDNYRLMVDLAFSCTLLGYFLKSNEKTAEADQYFIQARKTFEKSERLGSTYPLLYSNWSVLEFYEGNYQMAKTRLARAKDLGFKSDPQYEQDLENKLK